MPEGCQLTPIYKKGSKGHCGNNWRVISSSSMICTVYNKQEQQRVCREVVSKSHHGFCKRQSCFINCLDFYRGVSKQADKGDSADKIYLDFQKALSKLPHKIKMPQDLIIKALSHMKNG